MCLTKHHPRRCILRLIKHHAMERYGGVEVQLYVFLTSTLNKGEWSASRTGHLTPEGRKSIAH